MAPIEKLIHPLYGWRCGGRLLGPLAVVKPMSHRVSKLEVLYEDNHVLGVWKPALVSVQKSIQGGKSLLEKAQDYLREKYSKPGNVYVGCVHRLDRGVAGVMCVAKTSKGASRLSEQFRKGTVKKKYLAVVEGKLPLEHGNLRDWVFQDQEGRVAIVTEGTTGAKRAELNYKVLQRSKDTTLAEIELLTGRKHQIRLQLAKLGCPILGDSRYGSTKRILPHGAIALTAVEIVFEHPVKRTEKIRLHAKQAERLAEGWLHAN